MHELSQQNALLKKAVAIQHTRAQKMAAEKDAQLQQAQQLLAQAQHEKGQLEAANYALNVHLKQATASAYAPQRPPDVF